MGIQNKLLFLFLSVSVLCTFICGLYFFEKNDPNVSNERKTYTAFLSDDGKKICLTDVNGIVSDVIDISGISLSNEENDTLKKGIRAKSFEELMSIAEDYLD